MRNNSLHFLNHCSFCGSKKREIIFSFDKQKMVKCLKCGLFYLNRQRVDVENLYTGNYFSSVNGEKDGNYHDYVNQEKPTIKNFAFAYNYIYANMPRKKKILEIGAGFGYFLKQIRVKIHKEAVEINREAASRIDAEKIYNNDFMKVKIKGNYDFIVAFDLIEHQIYIREFLSKVYDLLNDNGVFIFTTPNYGSFLNKIFGKNAPTIQLLYHNYYFNKKWLVNQIPETGFKVIYLRTSHLTYLSIGQIILLASFALPIINKLKLSKGAKILRIDDLVIPFIRFGNIECILQK